MKTAYLAMLNGNSVGDTISMMTHDLSATLAGADLYWYLFVPGGEPKGNFFFSEGWLNIELFWFYRKGGLFKNLIVIPRIPIETYHEKQWHDKYITYIEYVYGKKYDEIVGAPFDHWKAAVTPDQSILGSSYLPEQIRERFSFLKQDREPYVTIQPSSGRYNNGGSDGVKRISWSKVVEYLNPRESKTNIFILGASSDSLLNDIYAKKLAQKYPKSKVINLTGKLAIEEYFRMLYNTSYHLSCDSNSSFFTGHLGIPSAIVFLKKNATTGYANFVGHFRNHQTMKFDVDNVDVCMGTSDLES